MPTPARPAIAGALLALAFVAGCASSQRADRLPQPAPAPATADIDTRALPIFEGHTGLPTSWDSLVASSARADVVLIGEQHGHPVGLAAAARLYEQVARRKPNTAALSMEFFERDEQAHLDDYIARITDEDAFRAASGRTGGNYPAGHRDMVETARELNRPVIAANAPRRYVRLARTGGFDRLRALTAEQRRLFTIPASLSEGSYRERFFALMSGMAAHSAPDGQSEDPTPQQRADAEARAQEMVLSFFRAQNVWDATMAHAIADAVRAGNAPVVHVVGQFHVDHDGGLLTRLCELLPDAEILTVTVSNETGPAMTEADRHRADRVIHVGPAR